MPTPSTRAPRVPDKPTLDNLEERWAAAWEEAGIYRFDDTATRDEVFSIDTPPPTVSGSLHMGSVFGYVQTDAIARYRRMRGWKLFYPMGWDDNGLPTERRVQTYFGVTCDPSLPYDPDFTPPEEPGKEDVPVSRPNFIALCHQLTARGRAGLRGPVATGRAVGRLGAHLRHHRRQKPAHQPAHVPAQPGPGRGLHVRGADAVGRGLPDGGGPGRDGGPRAGRRLPPPALRRHRDRDDAARTGGRLRGPGRPPRRRALRGPLRLDGAHAALRGRGAGPGPPPGRAGQGIGHRHDLHLRRRDRRRVVARARSADAEHRDAVGPDHRDAAAGRSRQRALARHRRPEREAGAAGHGRAAGRLGRPGRRPTADQAPGEVLRAGKPPPRDRHEPAVVHPQRRPRRVTAARACSSGERSSTGTRPTCRSATTTGSAG